MAGLLFLKVGTNDITDGRFDHDLGGVELGFNFYCTGGVFASTRL